VAAQSIIALRSASYDVTPGPEEWSADVERSSDAMGLHHWRSKALQPPL